MHFSIPDTEECTDENGSSYTAFNLHINGVYHCSVRYRQFHNFHEQLKKEYGAPALPQFPPKKLLSLTSAQLEERRLLLEKYIQTLSQNLQIAAGSAFNNFLLHAQQESQKEEAEDVTLDIFLMNGHKIPLSLSSTDQTDDVLEAMAAQISLADDFVYYFGLFLIKKEDVGENSIVRKLQEFESPYISLKAANKTGTHRIVLRKSFWDPVYDDDLIEDRVAMNLLFVQAVSDIERGWTAATKEQHAQLDLLQKRGSKKEYVRLARTLKYYSYIQFHQCLTDYPQGGCRTIISAGNRELVFRIIENKQIREVGFRVTRMRCWRITTTLSEENGDENVNGAYANPKLELAFEYLIAKDTLKWITITSDQAILISMCLQGMVDEVMMKKQGRRMKRPVDRVKSEKKPLGAVRKDQSSSLRSPGSHEERSVSLFGVKSSHLRSPQTHEVGQVVENDAFRDIGDDDL